MKKKTITVDCITCDEYMKVDDDGNFTCSWGVKNKPKIMAEQKGKTPLQCKLKR